MLPISPTKNSELADSARNYHVRRRTVVKWSSGALIAALAFSGKIPGLTINDALAQGAGGPAMGNSDAVDLGDGDIGILNYALALEQLEAAFYTQVVKTPYQGMESDAREVLTTIRNHEIIHREFLKAALKTKAIPDLEVDFTKVDFNSKDSVLQTAETFENLGVGAYNGAGKMLKNGDYLLLAGKIVSVEARHAAAIAGLMGQQRNGAVNEMGLDQALSPSDVLPKAAPFIKTKVTAKGLT